MPSRSASRGRISMWESAIAGALGAALFVSVTACGLGAASPAAPASTPTSIPTATPPPPTPTTTPAAPTKESWKAFGGTLGTFTFTVNPSHVGITQIHFQFPGFGFSCGGNSASGGVGITPSAPWPITGGRFTIDAGSVTPFDDITVAGAFDGTGMQAAGTWVVKSGATTCTDSWQSVN